MLLEQESKLYCCLEQNEIDIEECFGVNKKEIDRILKDAEKDGIITDFTILSIPSVLSWLLNRCSDSQNDIYSAGIIDCANYHDESRNYIFCAAYYLGESFVRASDSLLWDTNTNYYTNSRLFPIVIGFRNYFKMYPLNEIHYISNMLQSKRTDTLEQKINELLCSWLVKIR